jgi:hypothetical protein
MEPITAKSALWRVRRPAKFLDISLEERVGYIADALLWYACPGNMDHQITIVDPWEECKCILDRSEHNYYHSNIPRRYVKDILPLLEKKFPECKITVDTKKIDIRWDEKLIEMFESLSKTSNKYILTAYCSVLDINNDKNLKNEPLKIVGYEEFSADGNLMLKPHYIENHSLLKSPIPARFVSGHFIFSKGVWIKECPYDPNLYFHGEEVSLSIRTFTNGYDIYHPHYAISWHEYIRSGNQKHWDDHKEDGDNSWWKLDQRAKKRLRKLLRQESNEENLECYNVGNARSFHEYELYTGIDFSNKKVGKKAKLGEDPTLLSDEEWQKEINSEIKNHNLVIEWNSKDIDDCDDCDFWFFGIETSTDKLIYRNDFNESNKNILNKIENRISISFESEDKPHHFIIWPHSKNKGWLKKYTNIIH